MSTFFYWIRGIEGGEGGSHVEELLQFFPVILDGL